jgi:tripartite-type tricarboxylate transporter receptor subunit TctC
MMNGLNNARTGMKCAAAAVVWMCAGAAWPEDFPNKPVHYVVPFGAGGSPDIVARLLADKLTRLWGQQVIVENRAGVAGVLGSAYVAKSTPDGHTLLQCNIAPNAIGVTMFKKLPYDQMRDFAPITRIGGLPNILLSHPSLPVHSIKELIAYAKARPGKLSYSSGQVGTSPQLSVEMLKLATKINIVNIPYKIGAQGLTDAIGGQVPLNISNLPQSISPVQTGRLRALAVTSAKRAAPLPNVPTMQESGVAGYEVNSWYGVCAPSATPTEILDKLNADITTVLRMPDLQKRLLELITEITPTSRAEFEQFIRAEITRWATVIKDANIPRI